MVETVGVVEMVIVRTSMVRGGVREFKGQSWKTLLHHQTSLALGFRLLLTSYAVNTMGRKGIGNFERRHGKLG
ncbi:unnamed protein product [Prunus armeniaca]